MAYIFCFSDLGKYRVTLGYCTCNIQKLEEAASKADLRLDGFSPSVEVQEHVLFVIHMKHIPIGFFRLGSRNSEENSV